MSFTPFIDLLVSLLCPHSQTSMDSSSSSSPPADQATRAASGSLASTSQPGSASPRQPHSLAPAQPGSEAPVRPADTVKPAATAGAGAVPGKRPEASPWQALFALHEHSTAYRACLLGVLQGSDAQLICASVRALAAVVHSKAASVHVLSSAGQLLLSVLPSVLASVLCGSVCTAVSALSVLLC